MQQPSASTERTLFVGPHIPSEIKELGKLLKLIDKHTFRSMVKLIIIDLEKRLVTQVQYKAVRESISEPVTIDAAFSGLHKLLRLAYRIPDASLKQEIFKEDLKELRIPSEFISDLVNVVFGSRRSAVEIVNLQKGPHFSRLEKFKWRVNVAISSSTLSRVLEPSLLMETEDGEGCKKTFEVSSIQFNQLRFAVACLLKEMEDLEKKNTLKI